MRGFKTWFVLIVLCLLSAQLAADVRLPSIISSYMVLQRDMQVPVYGWAEPAESVTVQFAQNTVSTTADAQGKWSVNLPAMKASFELGKMTITANNTIELSNIMVGDVWLCSGQSNMEMGILALNSGEKISNEAQYSGKIRLFGVANVVSRTPLDEVKGHWADCEPESLRSIDSGRWGGFSAVGYLFGKQMYHELNVPIGLVHASWGGSKAEAWTSRQKIYSIDVLKPVQDELDVIEAEYAAQITGSLDKVQQWMDRARKAIKDGTDIPTTPTFPYSRLEKGELFFQKPTSIFNGMINPIIPFAIRGAIWYQGESNCGDGMLYYEKQKAMIEDWRQRWDIEFPFYYVQIAPFRYGFPEPHLQRIWEAQTECLKIPKTAMAATIDITDDFGDIHLQNKFDVAKRLALCALANEFGRDIEYSGPIYKSMSVEANKIRIKFDHTGSGLIARNNQSLNWFEIAGADKEFFMADAVIDSDTVVVSSPDVPVPAAVRFGWNETAVPNLCNKEGLPAVPFRTCR